MSGYPDELYELLDEFNARVEEIFEERADSDSMEVILPMFNRKLHEFLDEFQEEVEKIELIEMAV